MSADDVGKRILNEIQHETLDELLRSIHAQEIPHPRDRLHIPCIDHVLDGVQYGHVQQEKQDVAASSVEDHGGQSTPYCTGMPGSRQMRPASEISTPTTTIEITGGSCSGKTHLLYYITALGVLPVSLGGREAAVVVLDTDGRFDVVRLHQVMRGCILSHLHCKSKSKTNKDSDHSGSSAKTSPPEKQKMDETIQASLKHVHIFRPESSSSLLATIESLPDYLLQFSSSLPSSRSRAVYPQHFSSERFLHAILLDSSNAFYWQDRFHHDQLLLTTTLYHTKTNTNTKPNISSSSSSFLATDPKWKTKQVQSRRTEILTALRTLPREFSALLVFTSWDLSSPIGSNTSPVKPSVPLGLLLQSSSSSSNNRSKSGIFVMRLRKERRRAGLSSSRTIDVGADADADDAGVDEPEKNQDREFEYDNPNHERQSKIRDSITLEEEESKMMTATVTTTVKGEITYHVHDPLNQQQQQQEEGRGGAGGEGGIVTPDDNTTFIEEERERRRIRKFRMDDEEEDVDDHAIGTGTTFRFWIGREDNDNNDGGGGGDGGVWFM